MFLKNEVCLLVAYFPFSCAKGTAERSKGQLQDGVVSDCICSVYVEPGLHAKSAECHWLSLLAGLLVVLKANTADLSDYGLKVLGAEKIDFIA